MAPEREKLYRGLNDIAQAFLANGQEDMSAPSGTARIDGDGDAPVGRVFETGWYREGGRKFSVNLRFRRPCANRPPGDEIGGVLGRDGVQKLAAGRQSQLGYVEKKRACDPQPLVDLEAPVQVWIIDEAFPTDCGSRFLKVDAHDNQKIVFGFLGVLFK